MTCCFCWIVFGVVVIKYFECIVMNYECICTVLYIMCDLLQVHRVCICFHLALVLQYVTMHTKWCFGDWKQFDAPARSRFRNAHLKKEREKKRRMQLMEDIFRLPPSRLWTIHKWMVNYDAWCVNTQGPGENNSSPTTNDFQVRRLSPQLGM